MLLLLSVRKNVHIFILLIIQGDEKVSNHDLVFERLETKDILKHYGLTYIFVPYVIFIIDWVRPEDDAVKRYYGTQW